MIVISMSRKLSKNRRGPLRCGTTKKTSSRKEKREPRKLMRMAKMRFPFKKSLKSLLRKLLRWLMIRWNPILSTQTSRECVNAE